MLAKINIAIYIIATFLHYINGQLSLLWLSVILGIVTTGLSMCMSYLRVRLVLKGFKETVSKMEYDGERDDDILAFIDKKTEIDETELLEPPSWMFLVMLIGIATGFILVVTGVLGRI